MPAASPLQAAANIRAMAGVSVAAAQRGTVQVGVMLANEIKRLLSLPHAGPSYWSAPGRPGGNPSSLPGEPPALQTGWLRSSYAVWQEGPGEVSVGSRGTPPGGQNYAGFLEGGTSRMAARPHVRPAIANVREKIGPTVAAEVTQAQVEARKAMGP